MKEEERERERERERGREFFNFFKLKDAGTIYLKSKCSFNMLCYNTD